MIIDEENISEKSSSLTLFLCLVFGQFGAHRFYVGKYISGILFLLVGGTSIAFDFLGFGYAFIVRIIYFIFMIIDIYALYSDSFSDKDGKLVLDNYKTMVYEDLQEREKIISIQKLDKALCFVCAIASYIVYYLVLNYVI